MNSRHVVKYTIYEHVKLEFQCYFKCTYLDLAVVVNIVEGGIDMVDTIGLLKTCMKKLQDNKEKEVINILNSVKSVHQVAEMVHVSKSTVSSP